MEKKREKFNAGDIVIYDDDVFANFNMKTCKGKGANKGKCKARIVRRDKYPAFYYIRVRGQRKLILAHVESLSRIPAA